LLALCKDIFNGIVQIDQNSSEGDRSFVRLVADIQEWFTSEGRVSASFTDKVKGVQVESDSGMEGAVRSQSSRR
jgi:hypothetical protein